MCKLDQQGNYKSIVDGVRVCFNGEPCTQHGNKKCKNCPVFAQLNEEINEALIRCHHCNKVVPKTQLCIYCGKPLLYTPPPTQ